MNGYRCDSGGDGGKFTITIVNNGVKNIMPVSAANAFRYNYQLNESVEIGRYVNNCAYMFYGCSNFKNNVYFQATNGNINVYGMFGNTGNTYRKNVYYNSGLGNLANMNIGIGSSADNVTTITNGYYLPDFNLYLYNNYAP